MESPREDAGFLDKIRPPRLEDAGLEDCALPPESIKEAFLKAATAVGSRAASVFYRDNKEAEDCVSDPWPEKKVSPVTTDALVGIDKEREDPGPCEAKKGSAVGHEADLAVGEGEWKVDEVVIVGVGGRRGGEQGSCVDGMSGLEIGEKEEEKVGGNEGEEQPGLVEGYVNAL